MKKYRVSVVGTWTAREDVFLEADDEDAACLNAKSEHDVFNSDCGDVELEWVEAEEVFEVCTFCHNDIDADGICPLAAEHEELGDVSSK